MKSFESIGIETELFVCDKTPEYPPNIHNAQILCQQLLGTNINAQLNNEGHNIGNFLRLSKWGDVRLTTDGTPVEFCGFINNLYSAHLIENFIREYLRLISETEKTLFKNYRFNWNSYYNNNHVEPNSATFLNAGYVYASEKIVYNARTNELLVQDKKEENRKVAKRSIGLHLHLELKEPYNNFDINNRTIPNRIVNRLNQLFEDYFHNYADLSFRQRETLQNPEIYRIKKQPNGVQTLEYRRLVPEMLRNGGLLAFLYATDREIQHIKI